MQWTKQYKLKQAREDIDWPIKLKTSQGVLTMNEPDPKDKKRSWWIVMPPNSGKTYWINRIFANQKIYMRPTKMDYLYESYDDEQLIYVTIHYQHFKNALIY